MKWREKEKNKIKRRKKSFRAEVETVAVRYP